MKKSLGITITSLIALAILLAVLLRFIHSHPGIHSHKAHINVKVVTVNTQDSPVYIKTEGRVEASRAVNIQPQITGVIKKIGFTPGQYVQAGQSLFEIDSTTYETALVKTQANLAKDQAQLKIAQKDKMRYQTLIAKGFVSQKEYEQVKAQLTEQNNLVKLDKAAVEQSQAELNYAHIMAPIAGKTGNVLIKEGDLVKSTNTEILVTINQLTPIFVNFYIPQNSLPLLINYQNQHALTVEVYADNSKDILDTGELSFIDNTVNPDTGMILLKASLPNKDNLLWPGQSVTLKLIFTVQKNVLAIPSQAVQTDQGGHFVYLIKNNHALITPIQILRQVQEWTFISKGLEKGDQVATVFPPNLQDNSPVVEQ